jgi:superfamily II DNA/RNA helicase
LLIVYALLTSRTTQALLYSATIPEWVLQLANRKLKPDHVLVNLIGDDVTTSLDITHYKLELKRANLAFRTYAPLVKHYCKSKAIVLT